VLRFLGSFFLISSFNLYGEILLSSPKTSLNSQDQRVIEFKIQNESIKDNDLFLYEYKTNNPINESDIAYTLLEDFGEYQLFKVILSEKYQEDYFSLTIEIKNEFTKDIFIFLPSKLRNYNSQPINIENKQIPKRTAEEIIQTKEITKETPPEQIIKGSEITTVWSMAEKIKGNNSDISIYQIMWSIYLGNKEAFINENINLIRKDIDIYVPETSEIENISYQFAKDSILDMNTSFSRSFSNASKSLLVLTAPELPKEDNEEKIIESSKKENSDATLESISNPKDFIKENTKELSLTVENETVKEFINQTEDLETERDNNFEIFDLIFISLISLASGALLALIFIRLRNAKNLKEQEYDFEEAKDDDSLLSGLPKGLSIENNEDQQQLDLAAIYIEMNDQENAKKILSNLVKNSDSDQIKNEASNLLSKIN
jgi:FimV-like protein